MANIFDYFQKHPDHLSLGEQVDKLHFLIRTHLWAQILIGLALGVSVGLLISPSGLALVSPHLADIIAGWLALPGQIFLALIQMVVIPLVISSIMIGLSSSGSQKELKNLGLRITPYFLATTVVAVAIGISVALLIKPGKYIDSQLIEKTLSTVQHTDSPIKTNALPQSIPDRVAALIPENPTQAALEKSMLQIVILAILLGIATVSISQEQAKPAIDLASSVQELSMKIVSWAMVLAPIAVFGLIAQVTIKIGFDAIVGMSVYVGTVLLGLLVLLTFYLAIILLITRQNPWHFLVKIRDAQLLAFSTSSSAAVMPLSMKTAQESLGVRPSIAQFIIPIGATVNMDGTALYQVIAAIFLTEVFGVDLTSGSLILLMATTVGASIGAPSTPGVGIVILATILQGIGVPASGIALILGVDRILDMCRTAVNVTGDLTASVVMEKWIKKTSSPTN
ncbi:MAG: dicarboxylate/amino acid:cation symporter [Nitrospinales bacterium]